MYSCRRNKYSNRQQDVHISDFMRWKAEIQVQIEHQFHSRQRCPDIGFHAVKGGYIGSDRAVCGSPLLLCGGWDGYSHILHALLSHYLHGTRICKAAVHNKMFCSCLPNYVRFASNVPVHSVDRSHPLVWRTSQGEERVYLISRRDRIASLYTHYLSVGIGIPITTVLSRSMRSSSWIDQLTSPI